MAVANHIHDLLYRYECVILPEFGAFITQHHSARIEQSTNEFFPPKKSVSFNRQLVKNDGLLANYIVEVENIPYSAAIEKLHEYVQDLNAVLEENKVVTLEKIGTFNLSEGNKLQFEPVAENNYLKEAFGLSGFSSQEVLRETYKKQAEEVEEKAPVAFTPEKRSSGGWLKYAAVGLLALGLSGAAGMNFYSNQITEHNLAEQQKAATQLENQIQQATFVIPNPLPAVTLKVAKQSGKYHIVAGAFRLEENAEKKVQQLKKEGYKARQIGANRFGLHQVVYSSHEDRLESLRTLREIKKSNPGAWLLVQEL
ncbi:Sporulation related domain-containing protein [Salinimicrobium catena]|uniref:Sporulation related domain-containing protein n=1 Tax=Salinimicrobium catena TaxID=390640 RepID=A0A1H5ICF7_9FLAO|nr:SPOR domain-containing protein [Salinimicrobium catena]SDK76591.1 Sporulation related domain-containing protein [Salinimicrobium catena]SEE37865.1 Sporulation related domain-containing protein [Salinimicrobium catena]